MTDFWPTGYALHIDEGSDDAALFFNGTPVAVRCDRTYEYRILATAPNAITAVRAAIIAESRARDDWYDRNREKSEREAVSIKLEAAKAANAALLCGATSTEKEPTDWADFSSRLAAARDRNK